MPHFEKMLYDNALLVELMTEVWRENKTRSSRSRIERDHRLAAARDGRPKAGALPRRSTPTARARRASSMSGALAEIDEVLGADDASSSPRSTT